MNKANQAGSPGYSKDFMSTSESMRGISYKLKVVAEVLGSR